MKRKSHSAILASIALSSLLASLGTSIANVALPAIAQDFGAPPASAQRVVLAYLLGVSVLAVPAGRIGDLFGRKRLLLAGLLLFSAAAAACAVATTLPLLVVARGLQGAGAAAMMALTMAVVRDALPGSGTGRAMGMLGTVSAAGTALGPSLGGLLVGAAGWRSVFVVQGVLGIAALLCAGCFLPSAPCEREKPQRGRSGTVLAALSLFREPVLAAGLGLNWLATAVVMASLVAGPFYLSGVLGLDAGTMGLTMAAGPVVAAFAGVPAGRLVDRFGSGRATLAGLAGMALGASMLWRFPPASAAGYAGTLAVLTAGYALVQAANNTAVMADASPERRGLVSGLLTLSRNLGLMSGAAAVGAAFGRGSLAEGAAAIGGGFQLCFGLAAIMLSVAGLAAAKIHRR